MAFMARTAANAPSQLPVTGTRGRVVLQAPHSHHPPSLSRVAQPLLPSPVEPRSLRLARLASGAEERRSPICRSWEVVHHKAIRLPRTQARWRSQALSPRLMAVKGGGPFEFYTPTGCENFWGSGGGARGGGGVGGAGLGGRRGECRGGESRSIGVLPYPGLLGGPEKGGIAT